MNLPHSVMCHPLTSIPLATSWVLQYCPSSVWRCSPKTFRQTTQKCTFSCFCKAGGHYMHSAFTFSFHIYWKYLKNHSIRLYSYIIIQNLLACYNELPWKHYFTLYGCTCKMHGKNEVQSQKYGNCNFNKHCHSAICRTYTSLHLSQWIRVQK